MNGLMNYAWRDNALAAICVVAFVVGVVGCGAAVVMAEGGEDEPAPSVGIEDVRLGAGGEHPLIERVATLEAALADTRERLARVERMLAVLGYDGGSDSAASLAFDAEEFAVGPIGTVVAPGEPLGRYRGRTVLCGVDHVRGRADVYAEGGNVFAPVTGIMATAPIETNKYEREYAWAYYWEVEPVARHHTFFGIPILGRWIEAREGREAHCLRVR